ncbi:MAG: hypothetical protein E5W83_17770 [Mesorhizobium sp.]|nr:MAG: hypothetical protein E5W83_17770 [Mesorhizobium sp.]
MRRMIRHFAFALILVQVAAAAALATQVLLFSSANARDEATSQAQPVAADKACEPALRPNIHDRCLPHVKPKVLTLVLSAER